jgi:predicted Zn-dependent protease
VKRLAALAALAAACASTHIPPRTSPAVAVTDTDERGMWQLAGEAQAGLDRSGLLYGDPALDEYLLDVARRLEPPEVFTAIPFRIRVVRDRTPNAFCLPNGATYVNTGMLALIGDEAELASLLGHELTHAVNRHALRALHSSENTGALLNVLSTWSGAAAHPGGILFLSSVAGYSRDLEREADREGLTRTVAAGYDAQEAPQLFERLRDWVAAEKIRPGSAFYASHPRLEERIESMRALAAATPSSGKDRGADRYAQHVAGVLLDGARADLVAGRFPSARRQVERYLTIHPEDAQGHVVAGEIARREGGPAAEEAALASYRRAVQLDPAAAEGWRGLGLLLRRRGDRGGARDALTRYLELAPDAPDRAHVSAALQETRETDAADAAGGKR